MDSLLAFLLKVGFIAGNPPVVVSSPHFIFCPKEVQSSVLGVTPNQEEFQTTIDIEPV